MAGLHRICCQCECGSHGSAHEAGYKLVSFNFTARTPMSERLSGRQIEAIKGAPHLVSKAGGQAGTKVVPNAGNIS